MEENMKKIKLMRCCLFLCITMFVIATVGSHSLNAFATIENSIEPNIANESIVITKEEMQTVAKNVRSIFDNKTIKACETLYNLDDSDDYISVVFENGGYAIFVKRTMELMEYSMQDTFPYESTMQKKYYAGPTNYFKKSAEGFTNLLSGERLEISNSNATNYSNQIREIIIGQKILTNNLTEYTGTNEDILRQMPVETSNAPNLDSDHLIYASGNNYGLIPNYKYFWANPTYGHNDSEDIYLQNKTGACGPVAAQLLLGYNNYYHDRRIISDRYLNGYDDITNSVTNKEQNPNYCDNPMLMNAWTTGTRYEKTGENSFYLRMISEIMNPNADGATVTQVSDGIKSYLEEQIPNDEFTVKHERKLFFPISSDKIQSEINAGRPIIISIGKNLSGSDGHFVVGYGCEKYTYPNEQGTYDGYVVHYGWHIYNGNKIWINSAWCNGYISLKINHTHNYATVGPINTTNLTEYKCVTCGHRTDAAINMLSSDRYAERTLPLTLNAFDNDKYYYLSFKTGGNKLIQTIGSLDTCLFLFDSEYNLLASDFESGYQSNSLLCYTVQADTPYLLLVGVDETPTQNDITKIGITPASSTYEKYEDLPTLSGSSQIYFSSILNTTYVTKIQTSVSGTYTLTVLNRESTTIDTYLYIIDPRNAKCISDDDSHGNYEAEITTTLMANYSYLAIVSTYDISNSAGNISLRVLKNN